MRILGWGQGERYTSTGDGVGMGAITAATVVLEGTSESSGLEEEDEEEEEEEEELLIHTTIPFY